MAEGATLEVASDDVCYPVSVNQAHSALVTSGHHLEIVSNQGGWRFQKIPLFEAAKLLAFLESCATSNRTRRDGCANARKANVVCVPGDLSIWKFEHWLIAQVMEGGCDADPLLEFLRTQESYGLVRFLLGERANPQPVGTLAARYGVSESHFRRLCRQALGRGLKRELRQWRGAAAMLQVVEGHESLTDVAMSNGFASSSHFSREIKDLFGILPCQLRRKT
ncbi:helix-turn-helix domain-containing protein [Burkholderia pyrrocinia]